MKQPQSGEAIATCLSEVLELWSISPGKVLHVITDNGRNMIKNV